MRRSVAMLRAVVVGLILGAAVPAASAPPVVGVGVGIGEVGTFGATLRLRPASIIGIEGGVGTTYYYLSDDWGDDDISGFVPTYGGELVIYFTDRRQAGQHGVGFSGRYEEVLGAVAGISYRYERYFGAESRAGLHLDVGFAYAPDAEENAKEFFAKKADRPAKDIDYVFIPLLLKFGFQF